MLVQLRQGIAGLGRGVTGGIDTEKYLHEFP
jgi:hypothetical protein